MDEQFELQTHEVENDHWWYRGRRRVLDRVIAGLGLPAGARILDAGCGSGRNMVLLARYGEVTGIELSAASVAVARRRGVGEVLEGSVDELPFADHSFDFAVSLDVLEHLDDDRRSLLEMRRVVRPGGQLLVTVPAYPWLWSSHDEVNHHRRRYTRATLLEVAGQAGWEATRTTHFNSLLLPVAAGLRTAQRALRTSRDPRSDLRQSPLWFNRMMQAPLNAEARLIGRGTRIPAGLSLLAVFR
jgi:SAM-dependent methyltransferase